MVTGVVFLNFVIFNYYFPPFYNMVAGALVLNLC